MEEESEDGGEEGGVVTKKEPTHWKQLDPKTMKVGIRISSECFMLAKSVLVQRRLCAIPSNHVSHASVADPYHFDTDPDPGCEKIRSGSGSRVNFDTDPDPGKNNTDPDPAKKD